METLNNLFKSALESIKSVINWVSNKLGFGEVFAMNTSDEVKETAKKQDEDSQDKEPEEKASESTTEAPEGDSKDDGGSESSESAEEEEEESSEAPEEESETSEKEVKEESLKEAVKEAVNPKAETKVTLLEEMEVTDEEIEEAKTMTRKDIAKAIDTGNRQKLAALWRTIRPGLIFDPKREKVTDQIASNQRRKLVQHLKKLGLNTKAHDFRTKVSKILTRIPYANDGDASFCMLLVFFIPSANHVDQFASGLEAVQNDFK